MAPSEKDASIRSTGKDSVRSEDNTFSSSEEERDEVKEVQKMSQQDTNKVNLWRLAATLVLIAVACAVTYTTYRFLKLEEQSNFETAVSHRVYQQVPYLIYPQNAKKKSCHKSNLFRFTTDII